MSGILFVTAAVASAVAELQDTDALLNNGIMMPKMAFAPLGFPWGPDTCTDATSKALQAGFRFVWSSLDGGPYCQVAQGEGIRASGIDRSSLFIAGTSNAGRYCTDFDGCYESTMSTAQQQFTNLGFEVLDMLMLDFPSSAGCDAIRGQWKAFEELYADQRVRTIAVSNFSPQQVECITSNASATVPSVNQLHYSVDHAFGYIEDNGKYGIVVQAHSALNGGSLLRDADLISIGKNHNKTAAQVAFKWILQTNGTVATQSTSLDHLQEDMDIFDFALSDDELATLNMKSMHTQMVV